MKIKIYAVMTRTYTDKNGNEWVQFATEFGDQIAMKPTYCNPMPKEGQRVILELSAKTYTNRDGVTAAFMACQLVRVCD